MTAEVTYQGHLRTVATHLRSGSRIETDAPVDNNGKGERFSPTDLVATALASCMFTIMGIVAERHGIDLEGLACKVEKIMASSPRRIGEIKIHIDFPPDKTFREEDKKLLENAARTCPVMESLHPDCRKTISFVWP